MAHEESEMATAPSRVEFAKLGVLADSMVNVIDKCDDQMKCVTKTIQNLLQMFR